LFRGTGAQADNFGRKKERKVTAERQDPTSDGMGTPGARVGENFPEGRGLECIRGRLNYRRELRNILRTEKRKNRG